MFVKFVSVALMIAVGLTVSSCKPVKPAQVVDKSPTFISWDELPVNVRTYKYQVKTGDTLYAISRLHGLSIDAIAEMNAIEPPYLIRPGQELVVHIGVSADYGSRKPVEPSRRDDRTVVVVADANRTTQEPKIPRPQPNVISRSETSQPQKMAQPTTAPTKRTPTPAKPAESTVETTSGEEPKSFVARTQSKPRIASPIATVADPSTFPTGWEWPVKARPTNSFGKDDGLNYTLNRGTVVVAAASGRISYAGVALSDYRYMILVKTSDDYVIQYDFNTELSVQENDLVKRGQTLIRIPEGTEKGDSPQRYRQLYFAIWRKGKPQNPNSLIRSG